MAAYHAPGICEANFQELAERLTHTIKTNDNADIAYERVMTQLQLCLEARNRAYGYFEGRNISTIIKSGDHRNPHAYVQLFLMKLYNILRSDWYYFYHVIHHNYEKRIKWLDNRTMVFDENHGFTLPHAEIGIDMPCNAFDPRTIKDTTMYDVIVRRYGAFSQPSPPPPPPPGRPDLSTLDAFAPLNPLEGRTLYRVRDKRVEQKYLKYKQKYLELKQKLKQSN